VHPAFLGAPDYGGDKSRDKSPDKSRDLSGAPEITWFRRPKSRDFQEIATISGGEYHVIFKSVGDFDLGVILHVDLVSGF